MLQERDKLGGCNSKELQSGDLEETQELINQDQLATMSSGDLMKHSRTLSGHAHTYKPHAPEAVPVRAHNIPIYSE